jgi:hypothetical protein
MARDGWWCRVDDVCVSAEVGGYESAAICVAVGSSQSESTRPDRSNLKPASVLEATTLALFSTFGRALLNCEHLKHTLCQNSFFLYSVSTMATNQTSNAPGARVEITSSHISNTGVISNRGRRFPPSHRNGAGATHSSFTFLGPGLPLLRITCAAR